MIFHFHPIREIIKNKIIKRFSAQSPMTKDLRKPRRPIRWKETLSETIPPGRERMRWSLDENAPVFWRKSRQAALLRNDPVRARRQAHA